MAAEDIMTSTGDIELLADLKFCHDLDLTLNTDSWETSESGPECSRSLEFKWFGRFHEGLTLITDDPRNRRPARNRALLIEGRRCTVRVLSEN